MSDPFRELLDAAVYHLKDLQARGVRFVSVTPEALAALSTRGKQGATSGAKTGIQTKPVPAPNPNPAPRPSVLGSITPVEVVIPTSAVVQKPAELDRPRTSAPADPAGKAAALHALRERVLACVKCPNLVATRHNVVFGVGNPCADLMFVGEAPGADEDRQGEPFVGAAGQLLTKIIQAMGLTRDTVYIANILKCRPDMPAQSSGNRKPTTAEMQTCSPYLEEQIDLIAPKVLVALGATAVEGLLGKGTVGITRLRGNWRVYRGIPLMPTYHPAYLLRNQSLAEKRRVWEDMLQVMEKLAMPVSERQRNFFLRPA
jgi:DNA polymerase